MKQLRLPIPPTLERSPELATLAILDAALTASESALLSVCPELHCGTIHRPSRGSTVVRANAVILQARRLAAAIAAYRNAVDQDTRRADREIARRPF
jgi:hypothetical protein